MRLYTLIAIASCTVTVACDDTKHSATPIADTTPDAADTTPDAADATTDAADATPDIDLGPTLVEERLAAAYCQVFENCFGGYSTNENAVFMLLRDAPAAECLATVRRILYAETPIDPRIMAGELKVDEARFSACLSALTTGCNNDDNTLCQDYLEGKVALAGECQTEDDCAGDAFCDNGDFGCPGHCAPRGGAGAECQVDRGCSTAGTTRLVCSYESYTCVPVVKTSTAAANEPCGEVHSDDKVTLVRCASPLVCNSELCQPIIPKGGPCDDDNSPCEYGTVCRLDPEHDFDTGTCQDHPFVATVGASCGEELAAPAICNFALNLGCVAGKCERGGDGTAGSKCFDFVQGNCNAGLYCDTGSDTCTAKRAVGEHCESDSDCLSEWCDGSGDNTTCVARQACE